MEEIKAKKNKTRSPQYPVIGLKEAVEKVTNIYHKDYQNPVPRAIIAAHMGYQGLNGKSLGVLSALNKYGLIEGRGNDSKVSDLAVKIIAHPSGTIERAEAIKEAASMPELFSELDSRFANGKASDASIKAYLITSKFIPTAADNSILSYRETKQFLEEELLSCNNESEKVEKKESSSMQDSSYSENKHSMNTQEMSQLTENLSIKAGTRRTVFALSEGDVTILFPEELSPESVSDLLGYLEIFIKKAKREAGIN